MRSTSSGVRIQRDLGFLADGVVAISSIGLIFFPELSLTARGKSFSKFEVRSSRGGGASNSFGWKFWIERNVIFIFVEMANAGTVEGACL